MTKTYGKNNLTIEQMLPSKAEAKAAGDSHYFTAKPCKHGHLVPRRVNDYDCLECSRLYQNEYYQANQEQEQVRSVNKYKKDPEKHIAKYQEYYQENREQILEKRKEYRENNKEKLKQQKRAYYLKLKSEKKYD